MESLLVGSLLTVTVPEIIGASVLALLVICFILIFYRKLIITTFDVTYARFDGVNTMFLKYALSALTSIFVVVGVRAIGALLISAFILFPTLISRQLSKSFNMTLCGRRYYFTNRYFYWDYCFLSLYFADRTRNHYGIYYIFVVAYIIRIIIAKRRLKDAPNARS